MIDLQHERSAAAETPVRRKPICNLEMVENADGQIEEGRPFTWPRGSHRDQAASGSV
jgi:hypothetical protein